MAIGALGISQVREIPPQIQLFTRRLQPVYRLGPDRVEPPGKEGKRASFWDGLRHGPIGRPLPTRVARVRMNVTSVTSAPRNRRDTPGVN